MTILKIKQKMSGTGSIHDLASDFYARKIKFRSNCKYAVILPAYFNAGYTTHQNEFTANERANKLVKAGYCPTIIDINGNAVTEDVERYVESKLNPKTHYAQEGEFCRLFRQIVAQMRRSKNNPISGG